MEIGITFYLLFSKKRHLLYLPYLGCTDGHVRKLYVQTCTYIVRTDPYVHQSVNQNTG